MEFLAQWRQLCWDCRWLYLFVRSNTLLQFLIKKNISNIHSTVCLSQVQQVIKYERYLYCVSRMMDALEIFIVGRFWLGAKFQLRISCYYLIPLLVNYTTSA